MIEHCISALLQKRETQAYQHYISECLRITTENTAKCVSWLSRGECDASYITISFSDLLKPKDEMKKTEQEIIDEIQSEFERLGFETKKETQQIGGENI